MDNQLCALVLYDCVCHMDQESVIKLLLLQCIARLLQNSVSSQFIVSHGLGSKLWNSLPTALFAFNFRQFR